MCIRDSVSIYNSNSLIMSRWILNALKFVKRELSLMYTNLYVVLTYAKQTSENNHIKKMMIPLGQCKTIVPNLNSIFTSISYIRYWKRKTFNTLLLYILFLFNNVSFIHYLYFSIQISSKFFLHTHNCFCWYHPVSEKTNSLSVVIYVFGLCWRTRLCRVKRYWLFIFFMFSRNKKVENATFIISNYFSLFLGPFIRCIFRCFQSILKNGKLYSTHCNMSS